MTSRKPQQKYGGVFNPPVIKPNLSTKRAGDREIEMVRQIRKYRLITPLFGGGVEPGEADPVTIIRGSSIRGQLRFWWRATRGGQFGNSLERMKETENSLWGASASEGGGGPSIIAISVSSPRRGNEFKANVEEGRHRGESVPVHDPRSPYSYVAFPLETTEGTVQDGVSFTLEVRFPCDSVVQEELEAAFWAWETFGGIGARTRRGFGSLDLVEKKQNDKAVEIHRPKSSSQGDVRSWINQKLTEFKVGGLWPADVSHLLPPPLDQNRLWVTAAKTERKASGSLPRSTASHEAWKLLIRRLKDFRQSRYNKSTGQPNSFGISHWPEARELRCRMAPDRKSGDSEAGKFPRAAFGLPINFHLPHDKADILLKGATHERFASPLLLRPLICADAKAVGLALILGTPDLPPLQLSGDALQDTRSPIIAELNEKEARNIKPLNGEKNVLKAFLGTLR